MKNFKRSKPKDDFIILRHDVIVNKMNIDCIIKTKNSPKDNSVLKDYIYVVFLKNSKYNWIQLTNEEYDIYAKRYL